ncbi:MAG: VCBS repeat-containing protein [Anaerolineales bacterium]|nr:VCBS repeat-containing protein [Anaerolineales bacterium]
MKRFQYRLLAALALLLTAACAPIDSASPTEGLPGTPAATPDSFASPVPATLAPGACPVPPGTPEPPELTNLSTLAAGIPAYLNGGGSLEALRQTLEAEGLFPSGSIGWALMDFTADGLDDLALSVIDRSSTAVPQAGGFFLYVCDGRSYGLAYASPALADTGAPIVHAAQDLNGDGLTDLLIGYPVCGAHTCLERIEVLMWAGATLQNRLTGTSQDLPTPGIDLVGPTDNGSYQIAISASGVGSIGAGPFRPFTRTWSWDPQSGAFVVSDETRETTNYRFHVLEDADQAAREGDYTAALDLYYRIVTDDTLADWVNPETERANLTAYAMFREMLTRLLMSDYGDAQVDYGILQNGYPAGSTGSAYAAMATAFWEKYVPTADVAAACAAAQAFASEHASEVLDPLYFGYSNPTYTASDVCPIGP